METRMCYLFVLIASKNELAIDFGSEADKSESSIYILNHTLNS